MKKLNKKQIKIIVFLSLFVFLLIYGSGMFILFMFSSNVKNKNFSHRVPDKYFLNKNFKNDPYLFRNPDLSDILRGPIISSSDPGFGRVDAPVAIVQFEDFLCDNCVEQEKVLKKMQKKYPNQLRVIWKDYPEADINSISFQASRAGRCAFEQGKFWEYHDFLFANNKNLSQELFLQGAKKLGLNLVEFKECLKERKVDKQILENIEEANALNIIGVPFLYVNDKEFLGLVNETELEKVILREFKEEGVDL